MDLFSGIGGFAYALEATGGIKTVGFCEIDSYCQKVLRKNWPHVPVYNDVHELAAEEHDLGHIDIISGGYPCQPFSLAGKRKGEEDDRHLWPVMFSIIKKYRPRWVIGENVAGHIGMGLDDVLSDLEREAYACRAFVIPACATDARHRRDRVWVVAHADSNGQSNGAINGEQRQGFVGRSMANTSKRRCGKQGEGEVQQQGGTKTKRPSENMADTTGERIQGHGASRQQEPRPYVQPKLPMCGSQRPCESEWEAEPCVGRVVDGLPDRVDRIKALGNAIVPQVAHQIALSILKTEEEKC